ncbi:hypothetical protein, partial [Acinetobacter baumannii]|uniref:hypothetical protein n=1 Tax=Acinetobacter baumannii TaxID=470 RepID=UPI0037D108CA
FIERLSDVRSLEAFLNEKEKDGWVVGEGFQEGTGRITSDFITGKDYLPTEAFNETGIDWKQVHPCPVKKFHRLKDEKIYSPPHI